MCAIAASPAFFVAWLAFGPIPETEPKPEKTVPLRGIREIRGKNNSLRVLRVLCAVPIRARLHLFVAVLAFGSTTNQRLVVVIWQTCENPSSFPDCRVAGCTHGSRGWPPGCASFNLRPKLSPGIVGDLAIETDLHRNHIFLHGDGIVKLAFTIEKLLQPE